MHPTELRYCACGATREAPAGLRIVSCVRCGRALRSTPDVPAPPSSAVAAFAALASQLVGMLAFCLAVGWAWSVEADGRIAVGALLALAALWVFAGGAALRGSLVGLGCCALLDVAFAVMSFANTPGVRTFVRAAAVRTAPAIAAQVDTVFAVAGGVAALAAVACLAAIPQVRRMAAWQDALIARLA